MTRRLLTAGASLAALFLAAAAAWAGPKPPDLPLPIQQPLPPLPNPEMPPQVVFPVRPNLAVDDAGMVIPVQWPPAWNNMPVVPVVPEPPPPVRPRVPATVKRLVVGSLLFAAHPAAGAAGAAIGVPRLIHEPCDRGGDLPPPPPRRLKPACVLDEPVKEPFACGLPAGACVAGQAAAASAAPQNALLLGVGCMAVKAGCRMTCLVNVPAGVGVMAGTACGAATLWKAVGESRVPPPEQLQVMPKKADDAPSCPYLRCQPHQGCRIIAPDDPLMEETVEQQFRKLAVAEQLVRQGERLRQMGRYGEAMACYDKARSICPGSSYDREANAVIAEIFGEMIQALCAGSVMGCCPAVGPGLGKCGPADGEPAGQAKPGPAGKPLSDADRHAQADKMMAVFDRCFKEGDYRAAERAAQAALAAEPRSCVARAALAVAQHQIEKTSRKNEKERQIEQRLRQPVSMNFKDTPLRDVVDAIRSSHGINIHVDAPALERDGISIERPVTIKVEQVSLKSALDLLLHDLCLTYVIKNEVLFITTETAARGKLSTSAYPVGNLLEGDFLASVLPGAGTPEARLVKLITGTVAPRTWAEMGGPATIDYFPPSKALVVNQTADAHEQIIDLLTKLRLRQEEAARHPACDPGVAVQVTHLLKACRLAHEDGRTGKAMELAREAHALDPERVRADALAHRLYRQSQRGVERFAEEQCEPSVPACPAARPGPQFGPEEQYQRAPTHGSAAPDNRGAWSRLVFGTMMHVELPPVDYRVPSDLERMLHESFQSGSLRLEMEEEQEAPAPPKPSLDLEFELEVPDLDLTIPEIETGEAGLPGDLAAWSLGLTGLTCAEVSNRVGQWRLAAQFNVGGSVFRIRYDDGDFELSVLPTAPKE
jgi:tetratricopeptide (TPR) repeat protein